MTMLRVMVWFTTIVLIAQDIARCQTLLAEMIELSTTLSSPESHAHLETPLTLLRARATKIAFSLLPPSSTSSAICPPVRDTDEDDEEEEEEEGEADPDVLPTILAYRDGELEKNWIRVDLDIGDGTLEGLLRRSVGKYRVLNNPNAAEKGSCQKRAWTIDCADRQGIKLDLGI